MGLETRYPIAGEKNERRKFSVDNYYSISIEDGYDGAVSQKIEFKNCDASLEIKITKSNLSETIKLSEHISAEVVYVMDGKREVLVPKAVTIIDTSSGGKKEDKILLDRFAPDDENVVFCEAGKVVFFETHPYMNPERMYGGKADFSGEYSVRDQKQWVFHIDGTPNGFSVPSELLPVDYQDAMEGKMPIDYQLITVPNTGQLSEEEVGFQIAVVPLVVSNLLQEREQVPGNKRKMIYLAQRFGHAKVVASMLAKASKEKMLSSDVTGYFVPTPDAVSRLSKNKSDGMPVDMSAGWCYAPEKGYGGEHLPLDLSDPNSAQTEIAFMSLNQTLMHDLLRNARRGAVIYSDTKQDAGFLNALAHVMGSDVQVVTKTYSQFEDINVFMGRSEARSVVNTIRRAMRAGQDVPALFDVLGLPGVAPDFLEFMHNKIQAAFNGIALYSTSGIASSAPERVGYLKNGKFVGGTEIVGIPLAFFGEDAHAEDVTLEQARKHLVRIITEAGCENISALFKRLLENNPTALDVYSLQLGTSTNLYTEELIKLAVESAKSNALEDKLLLLTGYKKREDYLKELFRITGIHTEKELPHNVAVLGMRMDIDLVQKALDVVISACGMGNINDAIRGKTALLMLAPDVLLEGDVEKMAALKGIDSAEKIRDDIAVMAETAPERALNLSMIARAYDSLGVVPNEIIYDVGQYPNAEYLIPKILYALQHKDQMIKALSLVQTASSDVLFNIVCAIRDGATAESIRGGVSKEFPDFHFRVQGAVASKKITLNS